MHCQRANRQKKETGDESHKDVRRHLNDIGPEKTQKTVLRKENPKLPETFNTHIYNIHNVSRTILIYQSYQVTRQSTHNAKSYIFN